MRFQAHCGKVITRDSPRRYELHIWLWRADESLAAHRYVQNVAPAALLNQVLADHVWKMFGEMVADAGKE